MSFPVLWKGAFQYYGKGLSSAMEMGFQYYGNMLSNTVVMSFPVSGDIR